MAEVKIDEEIYLILEKYFTEEGSFSEEELLKCKRFFSEKRYKRFLREQHVDDWKRDARLKKMIGE